MVLIVLLPMGVCLKQGKNEMLDMRLNTKENGDDRRNGDFKSNLQ